MSDSFDRAEESNTALACSACCAMQEVIVYELCCIADVPGNVRNCGCTRKGCTRLATIGWAGAAIHAASHCTTLAAFYHRACVKLAQLSLQASPGATITVVAQTAAAQPPTPSADWISLRLPQVPNACQPEHQLQPLSLKPRLSALLVYALSDSAHE